MQTFETVKKEIILDKIEDCPDFCQIKSRKEYCCLVKQNIFHLEKKVLLVSGTFLGKSKGVLLKKYK